MIEEGGAHALCMLYFAIDDSGVYVRMECVVLCPLSCKIYGVCACALCVKYMVCVRVRVLSL